MDSRFDSGFKSVTPRRSRLAVALGLALVAAGAMAAS